MKCFLGYDSALEFWRSVHAEQGPQPSRAQIPSYRAMDRTSTRSLDFESIGVLGKPVHLIVADSASRTHDKDVVFHIMSAAAPLGSFVKANNTAYVSSPHLLFIQMAHELSLVELVLLGYELCGTYTLDKSDPRGFRNRRPIASVSSLQCFLDRTGSLHGIKKARRALRYVADMSESPMESIQAMLLFLPRSIGGMGIDLAELNGRIRVDASVRPFAKGKTYRCDLLWRSQRIAMEYESNSFHTDSRSVARDSKRRTDLIAAGYTVVTMTTDQLFDAREFESIANLLIRRMGKRVRKQPYNALTRRHQLRKELFATIPKKEQTNPIDQAADAQPPHA